MTVSREQFEALRKDVKALRSDVRALQLSTEFATYYFKRVAEFHGINTSDLDEALARRREDAHDEPDGTHTHVEPEPEAPTNPRASDHPVDDE